MPPLVALGLTIGLIVWLFRRDRRFRQLPSSALWIPAIWLAIVGSRPVSLWLSNIGINVGGNSNLEGSPVDMVFFLGLMILAVVVLVRRGFDWAAFATKNKVLLILYLYLALSAIWSEHGLPTLKRAVKDFGHVLVALVLLSEADPFTAMRVVFVRTSFVLLPLSVVFIKYFPSIGRVPDRSGSALLSGVAIHKNELGVLILVLGLLLMADLIAMRLRPEGQNKNDEKVRYGVLAVGLWLLLACQSVASLVCSVLGGLLLWGTGRLLRMQHPNRMFLRCLGIVTCLAVLEYGFNLSGMVLLALGRDSTLTGRTQIWEMVERTHTDPLLGCGFYSFWSTEGAQEISELFKGTLGTVHNGLLEMYLDGGAVGLALLLLLLLVWGRRSVQQMLEGTVLGRLTLVFWVVAVIHNFSETGYFRFSPLWFTLILLMIECPPFHQSPAAVDSTSNASAFHTV